MDNLSKKSHLEIDNDITIGILQTVLLRMNENNIFSLNDVVLRKDCEIIQYRMIQNLDFSNMKILRIMS